MSSGRKSKISRSSSKIFPNSSEVNSQTDDNELNSTGRKSINRKSMNINNSEVNDNNQLPAPDRNSRLSRKSKHEKTNSMLKNLSRRESSDKALFSESQNGSEFTSGDDNYEREVEDKNNISRNSIVSRKSGKSITRIDNSEWLENTKAKSGRKSRLSRKSMFVENPSISKDLSRRETSDKVMLDESHSEGELASEDDNLEREVEDKNNISRNSIVSRKSGKSITRIDNSELLENTKVKSGRKSRLSRKSTIIENPNMLIEISYSDRSDKAMVDESHSEGELASRDDNLEGELEDKNNISRNSIVSRKSEKSITRIDNSVTELLQNAKMSSGRKSKISRSSSKILQNSFEVESEANDNVLNATGRESINRKSMNKSEVSEDNQIPTFNRKSRLSRKSNHVENTSNVNKKSIVSTEDNLNTFETHVNENYCLNDSRGISFLEDSTNNPLQKINIDYEDYSEKKSHKDINSNMEYDISDENEKDNFSPLNISKMSPRKSKNIGRYSRKSMVSRKMDQSYSEVDELDKSKLKEAVNFQQSNSILNRKSRKSAFNDNEINKFGNMRKSINDLNLSEVEQENIDNRTLSRKSNINRKSKSTSMEKSDMNVSDNFETHNLFADENVSFIQNSRKPTKSASLGQKLSEIDLENQSTMRALSRMSDISHKSDIFRWKESDNIIRVKSTAGIVLYDENIDNHSNHFELNADKSFHSQVSSNNRNSRKSSNSRKSDLSEVVVEYNNTKSPLSQNSRRISNRKLSSLINNKTSDENDHNQFELELETKNSSTPARESKSIGSENKSRKSNSRKVSLNEVQFQPETSILNTSDTIRLNKSENSFKSGKFSNRKSVSSEKVFDYEDNINEISSSVTPDFKMIENFDKSQLNESSHSQKSIGKMSNNKDNLNSLDSEKTGNISMLSKKSSIGRNSRKSDKIKQDTLRKSGHSQISRKSDNVSAADSEEINAAKDNLINRNSLKSAISRNSVTDDKTSISIDLDKNSYEQPMSFRKSIFNRKSSKEAMTNSSIEGSSLTGISNLNLPNDSTDKVIIESVSQENIDFANQSRKSENIKDSMIKESNTFKKRGQNKRALYKDSHESNQPPSKRLLRHAVEIVNESAAEINKTSRTMSKRKRENSDTDERANKTLTDTHDPNVETPIKTRGRPKKKEIKTFIENEAVDIIDSKEINLNPKKSLPSFDSVLSKTRGKNKKNNLERIDKNSIDIVSQENINEKEDLNNNAVVKHSRGRAKKIHEDVVVFNDENVDKSVVINTSGNVKKPLGRTKNIIDENIELHNSLENLEGGLVVQTIQKVTRGKAKKVANIEYIENEESKSVNQNEETESVNQNVSRTRGRPKKIEMRAIDSMSLPDANVNESGDILQVVKKSRGRGLKEASVENSKASNLKFEDSNSVASSTKLKTRGRPKKVLITEQRNSLVNEVDMKDIPKQTRGRRKIEINNDNELILENSQNVVDNIEITKDIPKRARGRKKMEINYEEELILENTQNAVDNIENTKDIPKRTRGRKKMEINNEEELILENTQNAVDNIENTKDIPKRTRGRKKIENINVDELILENSQIAVDNIEITKDIPKRTRGRKKIETINEDDLILENYHNTVDFKKPSLRIRKNKNANDYANSETSSVIDTEQDLKPLTKRGRKSKNDIESIISETSATKLVQEGSISRGRRKLPIDITKNSDKENEVDVKKSNSKKRIQSANVEENNEIEHIVPKKILRKNILSETNTNTNTENQVTEPPRMETRTKRGKK